MLNLRCQLVWAKGRPASWENITSEDVCVAFLKGVSFCVGRWVKKIPLTTQVSVSPSRAWTAQRQRRGKSASPLALGHWGSWFSEFQTQTELQPPPPITFQGMQLADGRPGDISAFVITWAKSYTKSALEKELSSASLGKAGWYVDITVGQLRHWWVVAVDVPSVLLFLSSCLSHSLVTSGKPHRQKSLLNWSSDLHTLSWKIGERMIFICKHSVTIISTQIGCQVGRRGEFEGYEVLIF